MSSDSADGVSARIDHTVTSGTFSLDGQTFDVDNNVWVVGDDEECVVIDAPHDVGEILELVGLSRARDHRRPALREGHRGRPSQAARCPGEQRGLFSELHGANLPTGAWARARKYGFVR